VSTVPEKFGSFQVIGPCRQADPADSAMADFVPGRVQVRVIVRLDGHQVGVKVTRAAADCLKAVAGDGNRFGLKVLNDVRTDQNASDAAGVELPKGGGSIHAPVAHPEFLDGDAASACLGHKVLAISHRIPIGPPFLRRVPVMNQRDLGPAALRASGRVAVGDKGLKCRIRPVTHPKSDRGDSLAGGRGNPPVALQGHRDGLDTHPGLGSDCFLGHF